VLLIRTEEERDRRLRRSRVLLGGALLAIGAIIVTLAYLKPNPFAGGQTVTAEFRDASGIAAVGADVRVAGVPVGRITDRERDGDLARVTMQVSDSVGPIHQDATAELRPHLAFEGTAFIELTPGTPGAPALGSKTIPVAHTQSYVSVDEALRFLGPQVRDALRGTMRELAGTFGAEPAVEGTQETLAGAPALTEALAPAARAAGGSNGHELRRAISGLSRTTAAVASRRADLNALVADAGRTAAALDTGAGRSLDQTLAELPGTLEAVQSGGAALERVLARLEPLASDLRPGLDALAPTLAGATPLVERARPALEAATPLIGDLRVALAAGSGGAPAARRVLQSAQPILDRLNDSLLPALHQPTEELGIPAYVSFLNLFGGGGGASRPFQTEANTTPLTPETGHFMRFGLRFLTGVGFPLPPCALLAQANPQLAATLGTAGGCTP
jgi:phospholipid/cholesterol/gamma-HCH transport system substrate-binding protein